ncbi:MAG: nuclear transport factor 2 family protein [Acidimicrobiales bacterium]
MKAAGDRRPYRAVWELRELDQWRQALAPDVVVWSPILRKPFEGADAACELFHALFGCIDRFEITEEVNAPNLDVYWWRAHMRGRDVEGVDLLRLDSAGRVSEIRVFIRPLVGLGTFASATGPSVVRERGRVRVVAVRALNGGLRVLLNTTDAVASRILAG